MAEPIGIASGVLTLAGFAVKSCLKLHSLFLEFQNIPNQARELVNELAVLILLLQELSRRGELSIDVDLTALERTLEQCTRSCRDTETELRTYCSNSRTVRMSARDWLKIKCGGDGMEGFRQQLIGYRSIISVAVSFANFRASVTTIKGIKACRDEVAKSSIDLEARLVDIQQRLETLCQRNATMLEPDETAVERMEDEQRSIEKAIEFCDMVSKAIEGIRVDASVATGDLSDEAIPLSAPGMILEEGLDGCMHHMRFTLGQLEKRQKRITESLGAGPAATISKADQSTLKKLRTQESTIKQCLDFCMGIDEVLVSQISNIENHAEGDETIQIMVSTDGKPINGKNRGTGFRVKQAGGHFSNDALQQVTQDFKAISIHQTASHDATPTPSTPVDRDAAASSESKSPFGSRHGPGFTLAERHASKSAPVPGKNTSK